MGVKIRVSDAAGYPVCLNQDFQDARMHRIGNIHPVNPLILKILIQTIIERAGAFTPTLTLPHQGGGNFAGDSAVSKHSPTLPSTTP